MSIFSMLRKRLTWCRPEKPLFYHSVVRPLHGEPQSYQERKNPIKQDQEPKAKAKSNLKRVLEREKGLPLHQLSTVVQLSCPASRLPNSVVSPTVTWTVAIALSWEMLLCIDCQTYLNIIYDISRLSPYTRRFVRSCFQSSNEYTWGYTTQPVYSGLHTKGDLIPLCNVQVCRSPTAMCSLRVWNYLKLRVYPLDKCLLLGRNISDASGARML